jgi:hypothetical protein
MGIKKDKEMKRFLLILLTFTAIVINVNAQDVITTSDGAEIRAKVIEIDPDVVKYRKFDNPTGPVYVLPKSEIIRIKYENNEVEDFEPVVTPPAPVRMPVTASSYPADWQSQMQVKAPDIYQRYRRGSRQSKVGLGLTIGGTAAVITGYAIIGAAFNSSSFINDDDMGMVGIGALVAVSGSICATVGTPIMIVGFVRKGRAKREYFSQYGNRAEYKSPLQSPHFEIRTNGIAFVF